MGKRTFLVAVLVASVVSVIPKPLGTYPQVIAQQTPYPQQTTKPVEKVLPNGKTPASAKRLGQIVSRNRSWFNKQQWYCLIELWDKESGWNYKANNPTSSAYGIAQQLKLNEKTKPLKQVRKGLDYIEHRYETPCKALKFHRQQGWY